MFVKNTIRMSFFFALYFSCTTSEIFCDIFGVISAAERYCGDDAFRDRFFTFLHIILVLY